MDDRLPIDVSDVHNPQFLCCHHKETNQIWMSLVEKALLQV